MMCDNLGRETDEVIVKRRDIRDCKPGRVIPYRPYDPRHNDEKISWGKVAVLATFCFGVLWLVWK